MDQPSCVGVGRLQRAQGPAVQRNPALGRQALVQRLPDEVVAEVEAAGGALEQAPLAQRLQLRGQPGRVAAGHLHEQAGREQAHRRRPPAAGARRRRLSGIWRR